MRRCVKHPYSYGGRDYAAGDIIEIPDGATRIRLTAPFFFDNHLYQPGEVVQLNEGQNGPVQTRVVSHDKIDYGTDPSIDANRILAATNQTPLYEVIEHDDVVEEETADHKEPLPPDTPLTPPEHDGEQDGDAG